MSNKKENGQLTQKELFIKKFIENSDKTEKDVLAEKAAKFYDENKFAIEESAVANLLEQKKVRRALDTARANADAMKAQVEEQRYAIPANFDVETARRNFNHFCEKVNEKFSHVSSLEHKLCELEEEMAEYKKYTVYEIDFENLLA